MGDQARGHSVLVVPVPELEEFVRARTVFYDTDYVSTDPAFTHAHITVLGPFVAELDAPTAERVRRLATAARPFDFVLERIDTFPNGIVHLRPEPDGPFRELTRAFAEEFPGHPPYEGLFPDPVPHLTLDALSADVTQASTWSAVEGHLPARCRAERLDLAWYEPGGCRVVATWPLGEAAGG